VTIDDELRLDAELLRVGRALADEVVRFRAIPLRVTGRRGADVWFQLAQRLRAVPGALEAFERDPLVVRPAVAEVVRALREHPHDAYNADFSEEAINDYLVHVIDNWGRVRVAGGDALTAAFTAAQDAPVILHPPLSNYGRRFLVGVSTAYHLQCYQGDQPILLPQARLASLLGYRDHTPLSKMLAVAQTARLLIKVSPHSHRDRQAAAYRFNLGSSLYEAPPGRQR